MANSQCRCRFPFHHASFSFSFSFSSPSPLLFVFLVVLHRCGGFGLTSLIRFRSMCGFYLDLESSEGSTAVAFCMVSLPTAMQNVL